MIKSFFFTPIGSFLRSSSLDELPQLMNILKGEMSFIGPRPLSDTDIEVINARKKNGADQVKPGITGLAQVNGRNMIDNEMKASFEAIYVQNMSVQADGLIVLQTLLKLAARKDIDLNRKFEGCYGIFCTNVGV